MKSFAIEQLEDAAKDEVKREMGKVTVDMTEVKHWKIELQALWKMMKKNMEAGEKKLKTKTVKINDYVCAGWSNRLEEKTDGQIAWEAESKKAA